MTYPQGPNYGGNPYQQQGGYPQTGGVPGQGGGHPGYPPPKKSNTGLIVTIVAIVVVLAAVGITGFVAPGFFLSDDDKGGSENQSGESPQASGPQALAEQIVAGLNSKNQAALQALTCPDAEPDVAEVIGQLQLVQSAQLAGPVQQIDDTHAGAQVSVVTSQGPTTATGELTKQGEKWCWSGVSMGGSIPAPSPELPSAPPSIPAPGGSSGGTAESVMTEFLTKVNGSDAATAKGLACPSASAVSSLVDQIVSQGGNISYVNPPGTSSSATLEGRLNGAEATGSITATDQGSGWCIDTFTFS